MNLAYCRIQGGVCCKPRNDLYQPYGAGIRGAERHLGREIHLLTQVQDPDAVELHVQGNLHKFVEDINISFRPPSNGAYR